jgi:hypothetical protein
MEKKKKISDFLVNEKTSLPDKEQTYVLLSEEKVICILGKRIDNRFKTNDSTKKVLEILSGTKSIGKVAEQLGYNAISLDLKDANINCDILSWDYKVHPVGYFNVSGLGIQYDNKAPYFEKYYLAPRSISDFSVANLPVIKFNKSTDEVTELADSFKMELLISPTDENFTVDVVQIGGTAISPRDYDYSTKTINVIKNNNYYSIKANISDDLVGDEDKTLIFALRNLKGPGSIGSDSVITLTIKDNEPSSVKNISETNMKLYPNPTSGVFTVSNVRNIIRKIEITDISGRLLQNIELVNFDFTSDNIKIDMTSNTGIHFIKFIAFDGQVYNSKLIVK